MLINNLKSVDCLLPAEPSKYSLALLYDKCEHNAQQPADKAEQNNQYSGSNNGFCIGNESRLDNYGSSHSAETRGCALCLVLKSDQVGVKQFYLAATKYHSFFPMLEHQLAVAALLHIERVGERVEKSHLTTAEFCLVLCLFKCYLILCLHGGQLAEISYQCLLHSRNILLVGNQETYRQSIGHYYIDGVCTVVTLTKINEVGNGVMAKVDHCVVAETANQ